MRPLLSFTAFWFLSFLSAISSHAQTASDVNEGCRIEKDGTTGVFTMSWWGRSGRTYFIQHSDDLVTWTYLPLIESGAAAVTEYGFTSTAARGFFRLRASDAPAGGDPDAADFDGDGLTNVQEVGAAGTHTDPLAADTDGDGLSDGAEAAAGTNPRLKDTDGDGFGDALELQAGTNPLTAASSPLHTGQMMLANLLSLWTAYLPVSQTGSLSQQQAAWDAAVEVQEELAALLALVAAAMPESLLMVPVSQPFEQLPLTMPQSQTPPTGDPGKAWLDTWYHKAWIGYQPENYYSDTILRFSGPNLDLGLSLYLDQWDDGWEENRPVDPQLKRTNFIAAINQAQEYMSAETAKAGNPLLDDGPSGSQQWGAADFVNPESERTVWEVSENPPLSWAYYRTFYTCRLRVERAADHERSFVMLAMHWKPGAGWQYEGTVTFRVPPKSLEAGIEISGLPWEWFRSGGDLLEMGSNQPLPLSLRSPLLPPGFYSDREKYRLVPVPVEVKQPTINSDGTAGNLATVQDVRMCRWNSKRSGGLLENQAQFPKDDPDRIVIRLSLPHKAGAGTITAHISTEGASGTPGGNDALYNDSGAAVDFEETASGVFESKPIVIVADDDDDVWSAGRADEGAKNDPTFIGWPGGKLVLHSPDLGNHDVKFSIKQFSHKVKPALVYFGNTTGDNVGNAIANALVRLPEIYAPLHVKIEKEHVDGIVLDSEVTTIIGNDSFLSDNELPALISKVDSFDFPSDSIKVVFISKLIDVTPDPEGGDVTGRCLYSASPQRPDIALIVLHQFAASATTSRSKSAVIAHEIGHTLRGRGHSENGETGGLLPTYHLMSQGGGAGIQPTEPVISGKHWYLRDTGAVQGKQPYSIPLNP